MSVKEWPTFMSEDNLETAVWRDEISGLNLPIGGIVVTP